MTNLFLNLSDLNSIGDGLDEGQAYSNTITPANQPPVANDDSASTDEDTATNLNVLGNDSDPDGGNVLSISQVNGSGIAIGTPVTLNSGALVTLNADLTFTYNPNGQFEDLGTGQTASDSFTYTIFDGKGDTDTATVNLTITGVNDAPTAVDDSANTKQNTAIDIPILANDSDLDSDPLAIDSFSPGSNGTVTLNNNDTPSNTADDFLTYTPHPGFSGSDSFTYTISDGNGGFDSATVTVTVTLPSPFSKVFDPVSGHFQLGEATYLTAFTLGNNPSDNTFTIGGSMTIDGTIAIGSGADQGFSGYGQVSGDYFYDPLAQYVNPWAINILGSASEKNLAAAETAVETLAANAISLTPTQTYGTLRGGQTIAAASLGPNSPSENVIRINGISLSGSKTVTIQGEADDIFVIQVFDPDPTKQGSIIMSGPSQLILSGGVTPDHVLWYVEGKLVQTGDSQARGIFLALDPDNKVSRDIVSNGDSRLTGQIFGNSISLSSLSGVTKLIGVSVKTLYGTDNADTLNGTAGKDGIFGREGNDILSGLAEKDQLEGSLGNDTLIGGLGDDFLAGGLGSDIFVLAAGNGKDLIADFTDSIDRLGLSDGLTFGNLSFSGSNIILTATSEILATLNGVDATTLTAADFITV